MSTIKNHIVNAVATALVVSLFAAGAALGYFVLGGKPTPAPAAPVETVNCGVLCGNGSVTGKIGAPAKSQPGLHGQGSGGTGGIAPPR